MIYPNYLDSRKRISEGRRVAVAVAVETPQLAEIAAALTTLNVHHLVEPGKCYPRDWLVEGRVRVDVDTVPNKQRLLSAVAEAIKAKRGVKAAAPAPPAPPAPGQASGGKKSKKR